MDRTPGQLRIILADDSPIVRHRLSARLSEIVGVIVEMTACTVPEAISGAARFSPDLVILDPDLDGYSGPLVLDHICQHYRRIKVIVFTNDNSVGNQARYLAAGAYACLDKALEFDRLRAIVMSLRA